MTSTTTAILTNFAALQNFDWEREQGGGGADKLGALPSTDGETDEGQIINSETDEGQIIDSETDEGRIIGR